MEPTSSLAGVLTGLLDGSIIAAVVIAVIYLVARRGHPRPARVAHAVAEDGAAKPKTAEGELPEAH